VYHGHLRSLKNVFAQELTTKYVDLAALKKTNSASPEDKSVNYLRLSTISMCLQENTIFFFQILSLFFFPPIDPIFEKLILRNN
jgi:hypothetical protein